MLQLKLHALACKTYLDGSVTHFPALFIGSMNFHCTFSQYVLISQILSASEPQTCKPDLPSPSEPFSIIVVGFGIRNNVCTSEPFAGDLIPVLDSSKSLDGYIFQVPLKYCPSLVYSKNDIKAAQTGGVFSVLHVLSLPIVHTTNFW